ncbi:DUF6037 family protein [Ethanoligenens sp.]|uniref:DUF6037 family protein n=1 Tax=Ethanoligenens sp. TaxID=2099655 RepID=UPI0039E82EC2
MVLNGLRNLYKSMKSQKIQRYKFNFSYCGVNFDTFFFIDNEPFKLALGVIAYNLYFEVRVDRGFVIKIQIEPETYKKLIEVLDFRYSKNGPFKPIYFFEALNKAIPHIARKQNVAKPHDIAVYITNVEESEKIYFCGWRDDEKRHEHVRLPNLEKTKKLLSHKAYIMCKEKNISSRWTADKDRAVEFYMPDI